MAKATRLANSVSGRIPGYPLIAYERSLTQSAANAIAFSEIDLNLSLADGDVVLLMGAEFMCGEATFDDLRTQKGFVAFSICGDSNITDLRLFDRALYGTVSADFGAAFTGYQELPWRIEFVTRFGVPLAVPPAPLFFAVKTADMSIPGVWNMRLAYQIISVKAPEAIDILKTMVPQAF